MIVMLNVIFPILATGDFNPANPPEPEMPGSYYKLTLSTYPANGGNTYGGGNIKIGNSTYIYTYSYSYMAFECWKKGDEVISTSSGFYYTPEEDTELVACFRFNPSSPSEPQPEDPKYMMNIVSLPAYGGYTNLSSKKYKSGEVVSLYAYINPGFRFEGWSIDGEIVSQSRSYNYTTENKEVTVIANFVFDPTNPNDPDSDIQSISYFFLPDLDVDPETAISYPVHLVNKNYQVKSIDFEFDIPENIILEDVEPTGRLNMFDTKSEIRDGKLYFSASSDTDTITGNEGIICFMTMKFLSKENLKDKYPIVFPSALINRNDQLSVSPGCLNIPKDDVLSIKKEEYSKKLIFNNELLYFEGEPGNADFEIYSITGKLERYSYQSSYISFLGINKGIYIVKVNSDGYSEMIKIMIK